SPVAFRVLAGYGRVHQTLHSSNLPVLRGQDGRQSAEFHSVTHAECRSALLRSVFCHSFSFSPFASHIFRRGSRCRRRWIRRLLAALSTSQLCNPGSILRPGSASYRTYPSFPRSRDMEEGLLSIDGARILFPAYSRPWLPSLKIELYGFLLFQRCMNDSVSI